MHSFNQLGGVLYIKKAQIVAIDGAKNTSNSLRSGNGSISGRVTENGLPVSRRVMLYERMTGSYAAQVISGQDGKYVFENTNEEATYFIVSIDDNNDGVQFNLSGQDLISGNHDKLHSQ